MKYLIGGGCTQKGRVRRGTTGAGGSLGGFKGSEGGKSRRVTTGVVGRAEGRRVVEGPYLGGGGIVEFLGEVVKAFKKERRGKKIFGFLGFGEDEGVVCTGLF